MRTEGLGLMFMLVFGLPACESRQSEPLPLLVDDGLMADQLAANLQDLPNDPKLRGAACRMLLAQGKAPEALELSLRMLRERPDDCQVWRLRAQAFLALEDESSAFDALRSCLAARPDEAEALFSLGGLLAARHGDEVASLKEAEALWIRLLKSNPEHPQAAMIRSALEKFRIRIQLLEQNTDK